MKEGGWDRYKDISDMKSIEVDKLVTDKSKTIEEVYKGFERIENDLKFKAFGKVTLQDKKPARVVKKKEGSEAEVAKELLINQNKRAENELIKLREGKLGRAGSVFKINTGPKEGCNGSQCNH